MTSTTSQTYLSPGDSEELEMALHAAIQMQLYRIASLLPPLLKEEFISWCKRHSFDSEYLSKSEIAILFRCSVSTIDRKNKEEDFPKCFRISEDSPRWRTLDIFLYQIRSDLTQLGLLPIIDTEVNSSIGTLSIQKLTSCQNQDI